MQQSVPPQESRVLGPVQLPGAEISGRSVTPLKDGQQPLRIPTVYAPFQSGIVFEFGPGDEEGIPGPTLHLTNITLFLSNITFSELGTSGFRNFFRFQNNARVCITRRYAQPPHVYPSAFSVRPCIGVSLLCTASLKGPECLHKDYVHLLVVSLCLAC
jgi:hypothetical protein